MGGLSDTFSKITGEKELKKRFAPNPFDIDEQRESFLNPGKILSSSAEDLGEAFTPQIPEPEEQTIIPIPDEGVAETEARKRRARRRGTGRSSTILTEGLGG